jgi:uncharacterized membrane protein
MSTAHGPVTKHIDLSPRRHSLSGRGFIHLDLMLLVATPVARVIISVTAFALQRDWTYVVITMIVLAVLGYSLLGGVS